MKKSEINVTVLTPESENNWLTNGKNFGKKVYIGVNDSVDNWSEITDKEKKKAEKELAAEEV